MAMTDEERRQHLADLGLAPEGEALTAAPEEQAPAVQTPVEKVGVPDLKAISDEELLAPGAFDRLKLSAKEHGRNISSPFNKALYGRIQTLKDRQRRAEQQAKREAQPETSGHVREKVKRSTVEQAATVSVEAMVALLQERGIDLDKLAQLLKESE